jgi:ribosomal 30S subunit maturation factor RimM
MLRHSAIGLAIVLCFATGAPVRAQQTTDDAKTVVSAVRLENGYRASKVIGAAVYNGQNEQVGSVADLFLSKQNQVAMAVISVGGFLGIGAKLVAVPFDRLQIDQANKVVLTDGTKDQLKGMPDAQYSN